MDIAKGEIFGLLGPNGAGKSTLVKIMMTVVRPDAALGTVLGRPLGNRKKLAVIGYLPENHRFPAYLTGAQVLDYYGRLAKVPGAKRRKRAVSLLERVGMTRWADTKISKYSKGMMQRLGLAQALINDPELLVLDEPTDGVDPLGRRDIRELLLELRGQGKTVFLNSHLLSELEMVCDRVAILVDGLVARQGTLSELTEHTVEYRISISGDAEPLRKKLTELGVTFDTTAVTLHGHDLEKVNEVIDLLRGAGVLIQAVTPHRFSLEDILVETMEATSPVSPDVRAARPVSPELLSGGAT
ncbi:MAG: ABC transporter ATP-binding protein [Planctomycetes bacterium]|nr:ABC transporter ATP-binding protein [Planctomycetota bacterium]